jgi:CubicO group peptidase (beta-lactamase class C family)/alpha-beta hydrolase superfamily lysophospholipase
MNRRDFMTLSTTAILAARRGWAQRHAAAPDFSWLDARLQDRVDRGYYGSMGLIIGRGERILHHAYFGSGDPNTVLHVASSGKWTAVAAIAALVDEGKLGWDDPVRKFLPQFTDIKGEAKLRQLLSHTAGYPDYQPERVQRDDYETLEESVMHIVGLPAPAKPGEVFHYGGLAMQVAGRMAEIAAGQSFEEIFQTRIARPLGMTMSGYTPVSQEPGFSPMLGGSLFTSVPDYGRFLMMIAQGGRYQGKRILSARAVAAMQADQVREATLKPMEFVEQVRADRRHDVYGLGQWREEVDVHGKPTLISSPGWAGAYSWLDKAYDVWGFVLAKANVATAAGDGHSTFLGSGIYVPMARNAFDDARAPKTQRGRMGPLQYEESGSGEPLIFLHGHSFDRRQWAPQIRVFEKSHRVIRYDLRGYGRSDLPQEDVEFLHAEDLRDLMDGLKISRAHIVGLSLGGFVATDFLALYPERVVSAVMAGGDLLDVPGPDERWTQAAIARRREEIAMLKEQGVFTYKRAWFDGLINKSGSGKDALRKPLWRMIDEWQAWQPLHIEPRLVLGRAAPGRLLATKPQAPVLIIRGELETGGFSFTGLVPQARVVIIPDCGHVSNMERPDAFNAALRGFLRSAAS